MPAELRLVPASAEVGTGRVHSVYRSTVNFTLDGKLFSLQDSLAECSPISFVAAQPALPPCKVGQRAVWDGHRLQIGTSVFDAGSAKRFSGRLPAARRLSLPQELRLPASPTLFGGSCASDTEARQLCSRTAQALLRGDWLAAAEAACGMLGLGCGLTPSGDDWLCGLLALLHFAAVRVDTAAFLSALCSRLSVRLHETNDVSARFLEAACAGSFSAPLCALFCAWNNADADAFDCAVLRLLRLGHSSGADTLEGIRFIYHHLNSGRE